MMQKFIVAPVCMDKVILLGDDPYKLSLVPQMFKDEDGPDFTGSYDGKLVSIEEIQIFEYHPGNADEDAAPELEPETINAALIPILRELVAAFSVGDQVIW